MQLLEGIEILVCVNVHVPCFFVVKESATKVQCFIFQFGVTNVCDGSVDGSKSEHSLWIIPESMRQDDISCLRRTIKYDLCSAFRCNIICKADSTEFGILQYVVKSIYSDDFSIIVTLRKNCIARLDTPRHSNNAVKEDYRDSRWIAKPFERSGMSSD